MTSYSQHGEDIYINALMNLGLELSPLVYELGACDGVNLSNSRALIEAGWRGVLVEASPYDKIWGIGISEKEAKSGKAWNGQNLLGDILTNVGIELVRQDLGYFSNEFIEDCTNEIVDLYKSKINYSENINCFLYEHDVNEFYNIVNNFLLKKSIGIL